MWRRLIQQKLPPSSPFSTNIVVAAGAAIDVAAASVAAAANTNWSIMSSQTKINEIIAQNVAIDRALNLKTEVDENNTWKHPSAS